MAVEQLDGNSIVEGIWWSSCVFSSSFLLWLWVYWIWPTEFRVLWEPRAACCLNSEVVIPVGRTSLSKRKHYILHELHHCSCFAWLWAELFSQRLSFGCLDSFQHEMSGCQAHIECIGTEEKHFCKPLRCRSSFTCGSTPEPCSLTCGAWQAALGVWVKAAVLLGGEAPSSVCCCTKGCFVGLVFFLLLPGEILFSFLPCLKSVEMDNCIVHVAVPALRDFWLGYAVSQSTSLTVVKKWSEELAAALSLLGNLSCRGLVIPARCCRCVGAHARRFLLSTTGSWVLCWSCCAEGFYDVFKASLAWKTFLGTKTASACLKPVIFEGRHK